MVRLAAVGVSAILLLGLIGWLAWRQSLAVAGVHRDPRPRVALGVGLVLALLASAVALPQLVGLVT